MERTHLVFSVVLVVLLQAIITSPIQAKPRWAANCARSGCHNTVTNRMQVTGFDSTTNVFPRLDGENPGALKTYTVTAGEVANLTVNVTNGANKYAALVDGLTNGGVKNSLSNNLVFTPDASWFSQNGGANYTSTNEKTNWGGSAVAWTFDLAVDPSTPPDFYELTLGVGGAQSNLWAQLERVYLEVLAALACDFDNDGDCDIDDVDALVTAGDLSAGISVPPADAKFDLDGNNAVDGADYLVWLNNAATENGHGSPYRAADTDLDRDVDISDFNALATNFDPGGVNAATNGQSKGNSDGDNDVDISDFNRLASTFAPGGYDTASAVLAADADPGQVDLVVDLATGEVVLDGNNAAISGLQVFSAGNSLLATDFTADVLQFVISTNASTYAEGAFVNTGVDGLISLGIMYDLLVNVQDLTFEYTMIGQPTVQGRVIYIPEPASLVLMGMGGLMVLRRRRAG